MSVVFTQEDLAIFAIPAFEDRMKAIREKIRPKLEKFGEEIAPLLSKKFKTSFFAHTAKHMRRKVNPPDETWVALGPEKRGYKAYIFFSLCIGKQGTQARIVMKDESNQRKALGENLLENLEFLKNKSSQLKNLSDYTKRQPNYLPYPVKDIVETLTESSSRLKTLKSASFDLGLELNPTSKTLAQDFLENVQKLYPFYLCGLQQGVQLS